MVQSEDPTTPTILAQPGMFGKRWTPNPTAQLYTVSWDLCNGTIDESDYLDMIPDVHQKLYGIALYFDPLERTGKQECEYSTMAQTAEKKYPRAQYLVLPNTDLVPMTKYAEDMDTSLGLATVRMEDSDAIKNRFGNGTASSISSGSILVTIDATSRSILDTNIALEEETRRAPIWLTITQITGSLSFFGSTYVIYSLIGNRQRRNKNMRIPFDRLFLAISMSDLMSSLAMMVGGWAAPTTPPGDYEGYYSITRWEVKFPRAVGNDGTCQAQAFIVHIGLAASAFFTCYVAIQTLLVVRYAWNDKQMQKAEYFFFGTGIGVPLITAIWAGAEGLFNPMTVEDCSFDRGGPLFDEYCEGSISQERLLIYQIVLAMVWIILAMVVILFSMVSLYLFVRKRERQAARWSLNASGGRQQKRVLTKSIAIVSAYFFTWTPSMIALTPAVDNLDTAVLNIIVAAILPLQGFFNALIFSGCAEQCLARLFFGKKTPVVSDRTSSCSMSLGAVSAT